MPPEWGHPKLLFVIDNLSTGGAQRQLINLATGLKDRNYGIEVFCYTPGDLLAQPLYKMGIPVHWHIKSSRYSFGVILALRRLLCQGKFNLALSFLTTPNFYTILAGKFLGIQHLPVVVSERFCDLPGGISRLEQFSRQFYRFADHVIVNSNHQRLNLIRKYPKLKSRISTIYNGYDLRSFSQNGAGPDGASLKLLAIASVSPYKNGLCLVEALNILRHQSNLKPTVTWIGQKVLAGDRLKYLNEMEQKIREYHLESQWQWLGQRTDIVQQLHQHDVLVHPSYGEGLPNVVCEALACGRPVIVSNTLDHPNLVQDRESGYLFDWKNPNDLAAKIKDFSELPSEKRRDMGQKARQFAEQNLSMSRYIDDYERLFSTILTGDRSADPALAGN